MCSDRVNMRDAYAVIIGIGNYRDPGIRKLEFTCADAQALRDTLADPEIGAIPPENIKLLLEEKATLREMKRVVGTWLFKHADPESTVVLFFAGHGGLESDKVGNEPDGIAKYLLPWDAEPDDLFSTALPNADFNRLLTTIKARSLVVFLDACYAAGVSQRGARDMTIVENPYDRLSQGQGRLVIASAQPNQRSWEDASLGHGVFTHHLLEALRGEAGGEPGANLSTLQVFEHLRREVPRTARRLCNSVQEPMMCGETSKPIYLRIGSGEPPERDEPPPRTEIRRTDSPETDRSVNGQEGSPEPEYRFCTQCGTRLRSSQNFCTGCGKRAG